MGRSADIPFLEVTTLELIVQAASPPILQRAKDGAPPCLNGTKKIQQARASSQQPELVMIFGDSSIGLFSTFSEPPPVSRSVDRSTIFRSQMEVAQISPNEGLVAD